MSRFHEAKAAARQQLHRVMARPAVYYSPDRATVVECTARLHYRERDRGDMVGFDFNPAERAMETPRIVFRTGDVEPERSGVFVFADDESYVVDLVRQPDGFTTTAEVARRSERKTEAEPLAGPGA